MADIKMPKPAVGQIWREVDPREERFVKVTNVLHRHARIATAFKSAGKWKIMIVSRWAKISRFNGKRGGYEFVEGPNG